MTGVLPCILQEIIERRPMIWRAIGETSGKASRFGARLESPRCVRACEAHKNSIGTALVMAIQNGLVPTDGAASSVVRQRSLSPATIALLEIGPDAQNFQSPQCPSTSASI
jgi:hypothetical protein